VAAPTWELLRELADFRSEKASALSLYVNLDPSEAPTPPAVATRFNSLLTEAERTYLDDGDGEGRKRAIRAAVDQVREWSRRDFDRDGVRGVAVFAAADEGLWRVVTCSEPVTDHVEADRQFALGPLVPLVRDEGQTFVALMDRERGLVFRIVGGRLEEIVDGSDEVHGQHDQGGWSQARYQRHIEDLVRRHLKEVGEELDGSVRGNGDAQLGIVAPEELRSEIAATLSSETLRAVVGWTHAEPHATPAELHELVRPIVERTRDERAAEQLARWKEQLGRQMRATAGWHDTLEAASDARVDVLLAAQGADETAYRCPACLRAAAEPGTCPLDGAELEPHRALDLAVHQTLVHGGSVLSLDERRDGLDSVGALLRF
jgi:peptide chain release factor subunit 1